MKKIFTLVCVLMLGMGFAQAQVHQGETAVGVNLLYGSQIDNLGVGARFQYGVLDKLRAEIGFNYFFEKHQATWWDVNLNAHYLFSFWNDQLVVYPVAGLIYSMKTGYETHTRVETDNDGNQKQIEIRDKDEYNHIGLNLGAGIEYEINEHFGVNFEYRHSIMRENDQGIFAAGINYKF